MKKYLTMLSVFTGLLFLLTAIPSQLLGRTQAASSRTATSVTTLSTETSTNTDTSESGAALCESYQMLDITSGKVETISVRDYLIGAVCAEMPATFETEALKAQAVAAHTYAERQHMLEESDPTPALCGADFSNDSDQYQAFFTENQARQYYGDSFDTSYAKICDAVDAVLPYILEYDGKPIIAAFCSMSSGTTESAETVWGSAVAYLVSVDSASDVSAPRYLETAEFSADAFQSAAEETLSDLVWSDDPADWITVEETSAVGTVRTATLGGQAVTGQQVRSIFGLRSAVFTVEYADGSFTFTTKGFGHGVGMSQYGANEMAKDGSTWEEILAHYYPNTVLVEK